MVELHRLYNARVNITETMDIYDLKEIRNKFVFYLVQSQHFHLQIWILLELKKFGGLQQDVTRFSEEALFSTKSMTNLMTQV